MKDYDGKKSLLFDGLLLEETWVNISITVVSIDGILGFDLSVISTASVSAENTYGSPLGQMCLFIIKL